MSYIPTEDNSTPLRFGFSANKTGDPEPPGEKSKQQPPDAKIKPPTETSQQKEGIKPPTVTDTSEDNPQDESAR